MGEIQDRVALVTGSGRGMGLAIARALGYAGGRIVVTDVMEESTEASAEELKREGLNAMAVVMDVTSKDSVSSAVDLVLKRWGSVDVVVNNAGGALNTPHLLGEIEEKHWDLVVNVNLKGTFLVCQKVIPIMTNQGGGAIVNISALAAHYRASLAGVQYTAAKAGVEGLTRQLAYDWGPSGIRVNAVAPTVTMTGERVQGLWEAKSEGERERILAQIPLRRLSRPEEIAACVVFLASDESSYVTGVTLDVVGGRYLR